MRAGNVGEYTTPAPSSEAAAACTTVLAGSMPAGLEAGIVQDTCDSAVGVAAGVNPDADGADGADGANDGVNDSADVAGVNDGGNDGADEAGINNDGAMG